MGKPTPVKSNELKTFMTATAMAAAKVLLKHYMRVKHVERKRHAGIVTEADKAAEDLIVKRVLKKFPNSSIITEEAGRYLGGDGRCWIIDPLDGTTNYAHGFPWFCISIGLHEQGEPRAGVIYHPITKELFFAEAGRGATLNGKKIAVSKVSRLRDSLLGTGFYYYGGNSLKKELETFGRVQQKVLGVRRPGSAALDLAYVACGRYDGFWERGLACWDVAAGALIVSEAGGIVTNYSGAKTNVYEAEIVATNGKLHRPVLKLLQ